MTDLDKLIAAVEAGSFDADTERKVPRFNAFADAFEVALGMKPSYADGWGAYRGSLDAALRLHEALLPRWAVDDMSQNGRLAGHPWGIRLAYWDVYRPAQNKHIDAGWGADSIPDQNPARAWLLAILRALIADAKAQQKDETE